MMVIDYSYFIIENKESLIAGVLSGIIVGSLTWIIHIITNTQPILTISKKICYYSHDDHLYRIKVLNDSLSNLKIISANFVISYAPNGEKQRAKNDIVIATKKEDPLLFGLFEKYKRKGIRTFDTFVIDAQICIDADTIKKKTSKQIQDIYEKGLLTINDFFKEDKNAIISAVFYVQNYRTGITRNYCRIFSNNDIVSGKFASGRSLTIEKMPDNPNDSDV